MMKYALITDEHVAELYGKGFCRHLQELGYNVELFSFPVGEASKSRATKEALEDALLQKRFSRDTTIIAMGGGVVTDLAGFLASTFCRGIDLILIPTTLMCMVDAAIGGKTGVNTPQGKNMIGSFYFPKQVIVDPRFLATLPEKEMLCGKVEILKAGLIADRELFLNFSSLPLGSSIERALEIKRRIVAQDPDERGVRRLLNFGHTFAHALETVSGYEISHGEAVAAGLVFEAKISQAMGLLSAEALAQIEDRVPLVKLSYNREALVQAMGLDKKSRAGFARFVLLQAIGVPSICEGQYCAEVPLNLIKRVF